ncbi:phage tail tape measure protein [Lactobacillus panisapium]|uniref:Phage tail tape measure protein n=1 Tax=Lactobacillus panisapium TaxID=2012495 RepID=A0ABX8W7Y6_9LACO|nr:phage tail tape measure protein [Lactobacillus panisapium]QYN53055.1 phage tail tape measure protein [Lactobacillus panisapium]
MAGNIPVGGMETDITLNGTQPVRTLKELRQAVTNATSAWKAQRAELSSVGKSTEAAKAKFEGLKTTIDKQKEYISGLTREQKNLVDAQKNVDRSTEAGKQQYAKYGEQIAKSEGQIKRAETRLTSLTSQQTKAKDSLRYYESGLAKLQNDYRNSSESSRIYISRLKEEHNLFQSSQAKMNSYRSGISNLTEQLKKQEAELKRVGAESGKTSDAYRKQENRVNKTGLSLAELKNKQKNVRAEFNKFHPTGIAVADKAISKLKINSSKLGQSLKSSFEKAKVASAALATGIAGVGAFAIKGAKEAGSLQKTLTENTNLLVTSGEKTKDVTKEVAEMQKDGRKYSIQYAESQQNIAEGYQELIKRGYDGRQSLGAMKSILQASKASGDSFADTMQVTTSVLEAFGMRTSSTAGMLRNTRIVANKLAMAADATATDFKSLGIGMNYVGTSAKTAGRSLTDTASAMGVLSNAGLEAQQAGTGLRKILISLQTPSKSGANALEKYGMSVSDFKDKAGKLKPISAIFKEISDHVPKADRSNFFHNVFGTTGQNAAAILASNTKELERVNKQVAGAYQNDYVGKLANKNMKATKNQEKQFHEAIDAVRIDIGTAMMPALSKASTSMVKVFNRPSTMKGIKKIAEGIATIANKIADLISWLGKSNNFEKVTNFGKVMLAAFASYKLISGIAKVKRSLADLFDNTIISKGFSKVGSLAKAGVSKVGKLLLSGFKNAGSKLASLGSKFGSAFSKVLSKTGALIKSSAKSLVEGLKELGPKLSALGEKLAKTFSNAFNKSVNFGKGLFGKGEGAGRLTGLLQSAHSAGGFSNLTTAGKIGTAATGAGVAIDAGSNFFNAYKDRHSADKRSQDIGKGIGAGIGGGIGLWFGGPLGAAVGSEIGKVVGGWGGQAVNKFTKGWQSKKPPKNFWSLENLGWSSHSMWNGFTKSVGQTINWFKKNWKEIGVYFISPIAGGINSLYKHDPKFKKWANGLAKDFKNGWKGTEKWFSNLGKSIQKSWKGMTSWFTKLGKNMSKGIKSSWKNVSNWFSDISKKVQKSWKGMTSWFTKLGKNMANGIKSAWKGISSWFDGIGKKVQKSWQGMTSFFGKIGKNTVSFFKKPWASITNWFSGIIDDIQNTWNGFFDGISKGLGSLSKIKIGDFHFANGTDWKKRYGVPAVLNDGNDSPQTGNREGILNPDGSVEIVNGRFVKRWLLPGQDVIKASDMAKMFGKANHFANGTVTIKQKEKNYKKELDRLGDKISKTIKDGNLQRSKELTAEFNKISKKYSALKKSTKKTDPHKGKTLVDQGLLTGADRRISHSVWISDKLFKQLTTAPKATKKATRRTVTTRRTGTRKSSATSLRGGSSSISTAGIKSKSVKISAKVSGTKSVNALAKAIKKIKNTKKKVTVKVSGAKSLKSLSKAIKTVNKELKTLTKTAKKNNVAKAFSSMSDKSVKEFKSMGKSIDKEATSIQKDTDKKFSTMQKKIESSMKNINSGVTKLAKSTASGFKNALHKMIGYAESDMKGTINALNRGIKGIDKVLEQFGGNSSVIKPVKFAKGTVNGALAHDTLAMVNDDQYGPRQEAIVRGNNLLIPHGKDRIIPLQKGDQVLNGLQTQELANSFGLPHFAKGSGMRHSALRKLAERSLKNYANSFKSMFTKNVDAKGTNVEKGFTDLGNRSSTEYGNKWSQAMWTVIENAIGDGIGHGGTREAFLKYAEDNFTGVKYVMGAASKLASDCSGMVSQALKHFGVNIGRTTVAMQESSGVQYLGKSLSKTEPGDLVIFGHGSGAAGHVGIIKNPQKGTMFNETPPSARVSRISDGASMGYGFYRVKGLHDAKSKKDNGPSKSLLNLAKKELGASAIKWIKKNLSEAISSFKISGDIGTRAGVLAKALKQLDPKATKNGITAILGNWMFESTLNPGAVNSSGGASGLGQWLGGRLTNLKAFAKKHGKSWKDPATQLLFALKHDGSDSNIFKSVLEGNGSVASLAAKFSQMWERGGYTAQHVAGAQQIASSIPKFSNGGIANRPSIFGDAGAEMAVPLVPTKATRAWELIGKAIGILSAQSGFGNQPIVDSKEKKEEKDFRQAVLLLLERLVNKDNSANITLTTPEGRTLWSVVEPFYKENERANQIKQRRGLSGGF